MNHIEKSHSTKRNLDEWLYYLEHLHNREIDMGLARISEVAERLNIDLSFAQVVTVAGTNGKGTTCAFLENCLLSKKINVAVYSSPHIEKFNERLRLNKIDIDDHSLVKAFDKIEAARKEISLSYYEYTSLAAFIVMMEKQPQVIILEVGLGGRLDATNIIDANIAVLTTIDLDHQVFLGDNRESIGFEKAGIMRENQQVVVGDKNPPNSVIEHSKLLKTKSYFSGRDFCINHSLENNFKEPTGEQWCWQSQQQSFSNLPQAHIPKDNIATALMVLSLLNEPLSLIYQQTEIAKQVSKTQVAGRTEIFKGDCDVMLDVGHNPLAGRYLAQVIAQSKYKNIYAVVGMLADKDISNTLKPLINSIDYWCLASLDVPRGAKASQLKECVLVDDCRIFCFDNVTDGFKMARKQCNNADLVLVFGSFFTVAQVRALLIRS